MPVPMPNPKLKVKKEMPDHLLDLLATAAIAVLFIYPAMHYGSLPEEIPSHYNFKGQPDSFGGKASIWMLPVIGIIVYFGLGYLNNFPHRFNHATKITEENAAQQYLLTTRLVRFVRAGVTAIFACIVYSIVNDAISGADGINRLPIFVGIALLFLGIISINIIAKRKG